LLKIILGTTKVLLIGGSAGESLEDIISDVQVINLGNPDEECPQIPNYPMPIGLMTAAYYQGKVVVCGGRVGDGNVSTDQCFELSSDLTEWVEISSLPEDPSSKLSSSVIRDTWVISGAGEASVYFYKDGSFTPGVAMPADISTHCQLTLNNSHVFFAGDSVNAFILDWERQEYVILEDMPDGFTYPNCGLVNNPFFGPEVVMAKGERPAHVFSLTDLTWREARSMPEDIYLASEAQVDGGFLAMGGYIAGSNPWVPQDSIYKFDDESYDLELLDQRLEIPVWTAGAVAVPDEFLRCQ